MPHQNEATFSRLVEALNRADVDVILSLVSDDVVFITARSANIPVGAIARFADGELTRWEDFSDRRRALEAAGLDE
jgi:ketosteroid isomerase-like protein